VIDPRRARIRQRVGAFRRTGRRASPRRRLLAILEPDTKGQQSYTGLVFAPDGSRIYLANVSGSIKCSASTRSTG